MNDDTPTTKLLVLDSVTKIVCATISKAPIGTADVPGLFRDIYGAVTAAALVGEATVSEVPKQEPAVNPKKSIHADYIICLEDGKRFKSLKRHLMTHYGLTPEQYRQKWDLKPDYPMVSPNYSASRSGLAKKMGLGRHQHDRRPVKAHRKAA